MDLGIRLISNVTEWRKIIVLSCNLKTAFKHGIVRDGKYSNDSSFRITVGRFLL
jgi:hypothetical protein